MKCNRLNCPANQGGECSYSKDALAQLSKVIRGAPEEKPVIKDFPLGSEDCELAERITNALWEKMMQGKEIG